MKSWKPMRLFGSCSSALCRSDSSMMKRRKGSPERLFDELELEPLHRHHPSQVHLDPPLLDGIARVRLPERGGIAVENVGREPRIGPHSADARPHPIVENQLIERIPYRLAKHVELHGAVDGTDARVGFADDDRTLESRVVQDVEDRPQRVRPHRAVLVECAPDGWEWTHCCQWLAHSTTTSSPAIR